MKTLIIYQTKYGSTKQYAEWIRQELIADMFSVTEAKKINFSQYDQIIFGSLFYLGKIKIKDYVKKHWNKIKHKKIILFSVMGRERDSPTIEADYQKAFSSEYRKKMKYFPIRGKISYKDMNLVDQFILKAARAKEVDEVKKENLNDLLAYAKLKR